MSATVPEKGLPHLRAPRHSALAEVRMHYEWDWPGRGTVVPAGQRTQPEPGDEPLSLFVVSRALQSLGRGDCGARARAGTRSADAAAQAYLGALYLYQDRFEDAIAEARKAIAFAPNALTAWGVLAAGLAATGQREEAEAAINKGASINPALLGFERAMFYATHGQPDEARAEVDRLEAQPPSPFSVWSLSQAHIALGNHDEAFKWLAHRPPHAFLPWMRVHPPFRAIRKDPRFAALMAEMRLPMP